jgi:hypothetical protein
VDFGGKSGQADLVALSKGIRTFSEEQSESSNTQDIRAAVTRAVRVIFLGFGFHKMNMELLADAQREGRGYHVFATMRGISLGDKPLVVSAIRKLLGESQVVDWHSLHLAGTSTNYMDCTCQELLTYFKLLFQS